MPVSAPSSRAASLLTAAPSTSQPDVAKASATAVIVQVLPVPGRPTADRTRAVPAHNVLTRAACSALIPWSAVAAAMAAEVAPTPPRAAAAARMRCWRARTDTVV